jgi:hypothetical protein
MTWRASPGAWSRMSIPGTCSRGFLHEADGERGGSEGVVAAPP